MKVNIDLTNKNKEVFIALNNDMFDEAMRFSCSSLLGGQVYFYLTINQAEDLAQKIVEKLEEISKKRLYKTQKV